MSVRRNSSILQSFNFAFEGVIHVLRTQRNLRIHFAIAVLVLVLALVFDVSRLELVALMLAMTFVLIAEMVNTAVEATIDVATTSFDPLAKLAKGNAAGAVLIAAMTAIAVGYLVFENRIRQPSGRLITYLREADTNLTLIALVITLIVVIATKAISGRGTPLRGGLPSGHAALAFGAWMAITFITGRVLVSALAFVMALLVAQTRVESGIHSASEVAYGAVMGTLVTLLLFQLAA